MTKLVVDSNVIWSFAYNPKSRIGRFIMATQMSEIQLYAPEYLKIELKNHLPKIVALSNLSQQQVEQALEHAYQRLNFISDKQIPFDNYRQAIPYVRETDMDDLPFVALSLYLDIPLWTGDKKLYNGLQATGYSRVLDFKEVEIIATKAKKQ